MIIVDFKHVLECKNIIQSKLAKMSGIRKHTIYNIYRGTAKVVTLKHIELICNDLESDINDVLKYIAKK